MALTDENGNIVENFAYDNHYGAIIDHTKTVETNNPYGYTGREVDADDLYYYRARYYDPRIQRFISEDPIGFMSGDFNWYRYVGNDPVNYFDPNGEFAFLIPAIIDVAELGVDILIERYLAKAASRMATKAAAKALANAAKGDSASLPWTGEPNSTARCRRRDGSPKQKRRYGPNGEPLQDIDYDHDHGAGTPHVHDWKGKKRLPGREPNENDGDLDFEAD